MSFFNKQKVQEILSRKVIKTHHILLVDDEESNRKALEALLNREYHVFLASGGEEALRLLEAKPGQFHLVISDQRMPGLTGIAFLQAVYERWPKTLRILLTAFNDMNVILDAINRAQIYKFILKPYDRDDLLLTVKRALQLYDTQAELDRYRSSLEQQVAERTQALVRQTRYSAMGNMILGMADRLKNPLNFVNGLSSVTTELVGELRERLTEAIPQQEQRASLEQLLEDMGENLSVIHKNGQRLNRFVEGMMTLSREEDPRPQSVDLPALLIENADLAEHHMHALDPRFAMETQTEFCTELTHLTLEPLAVSRALHALFNNALEAMHQQFLDKPDFQPKLILHTRARTNGLEIRIIDNGIGFPEQLASQVFDPFFTTKSGERGHVGLGLSMAADFIRSQGGELRLKSMPEVGTDVVIFLPHHLEDSPHE